MTKQVAMLVFNSRFSAHRHYDDGSVEKNSDYVDSMETWVKRALSKGIKVEATAREAKTMLEELLGTIPLPEEEETKMVTRYGLEIGSGMRSFETKPQAVAYHKRYGRGSVLNIIEVEVKA